MNLAKYGPWALIIGGNEGVGAAFARKLAAQGFKLVLTARKLEPMQLLAEELAAGGTEVRIISADLTDANVLDTVRSVTDDIEVGLLVYVAGANKIRGNFFELEPEVYRNVMAINVTGQSEFARHYGGLMRVRERGGMILTGSMAGYMGSPSLAAYCASKAFSRVFTEALWMEGRAFGIDVLHLNIGFTATPAMERLGFDLSAAQSPADVAQEGLDNIANGPVWIVGGKGNHDTAVARSVIDDRGAAIERFATPGRG
jgi:short-subunit dehydrogenase